MKITAVNVSSSIILDDSFYLDYTSGEYVKSSHIHSLLPKIMNILWYDRLVVVGVGWIHVQFIHLFIFKSTRAKRKAKRERRDKVYLMWTTPARSASRMSSMSVDCRWPMPHSQRLHSLSSQFSENHLLDFLLFTHAHGQVYDPNF